MTRAAAALQTPSLPLETETWKECLSGGKRNTPRRRRFVACRTLPRLQTLWGGFLPRHRRRTRQTRTDSRDWREGTWKRKREDVWFFRGAGKETPPATVGGGGLRRRGGRSDAERFCRKAPRSYPDEATPSSLRGTCSATTEGAGTGFSWGAPGAGPRAARRSTRRETNDGFFGNSRGARGRDSCVCAVRRRRTRVPKKAKAPPSRPRFPQTPRMLLFSACAISSPQGFWRNPSAS
mmetsp:Transcript_6137/g.23193  ORF Transcript_6137/g.23193 Transcript_6137/m.23193 type:complete len:236 (-) Transcript_6137:2603-3310(-)